MLLEICIDSFESARAAKEGGADRLEVCAALAVGGVTPSFGLVEQCVADLGIRAMMMIRPHDGGFVYDDDHIETMLKDIAIAKSLGAHGVVFGALTASQAVDIERCKRLLEAAGSLETTFHRAFDVVSDPMGAFDQLQELGFSRVLTSGQRSTALAGTDLLARLVKQSGTTSVLAGAGIRASNIEEVISRTGVTEIHASASVGRDERQSQHDVAFGASRTVTVADRVRQLKNLTSRTDS